jgi:transcriptional regulator with XRE-family HTH domain
MSSILNRKYKEVGSRIASLRILAGITREEFCRKYNINEYTLQAWELGRNKMRKQAAEKLCIALAAEKDIICTVDWIYYGKGLSPYCRSNNSETKLLIKKVDDENPENLRDQEMILHYESDFFKRLHALSSPVVVISEDNAMYPLYEKGDYLGGLPVPGEYIDRLHGEVCIIETSFQVYEVRRFLKGEGCFVLVPLNPEFKMITLESIKGIFEIIWHRKHPQSLKITRSFVADIPTINKEMIPTNR